MIAALLLAAQASATPAPAPANAIDAERAFVADAQKLGQWTAFRKWAADDAMMFAPQPVKAHDFLKDRGDPPVPVYWWPGRSYESCDGAVAVNTGPWVRGYGKSVGYFTTVWQRQPGGGWKWTYDNGNALTEARAEGGDIKPRKASCDGTPPPRTLVGDGTGSGQSADRTIAWNWRASADGAHEFEAFVWNGRAFERVIHDVVKSQ